MSDVVDETIKGPSVIDKVYPDSEVYKNMEQEVIQLRSRNETLEVFKYYLE